MILMLITQDYGVSKAVLAELNVPDIQAFISNAASVPLWIVKAVLVTLLF